MAEKSFMAKIGDALAASVENKQNAILKQLDAWDAEAAKKKKTGTTSDTSDTTTTGDVKAGESEAGGGTMASIDQPKAIRLQVLTAELSTISAAATGVINAEKTAITAITRNI